MDIVVYLGLAAVHSVITILIMRVASTQKSIALWLLALSGIGLAFDNAILGVGTLIGAGDTLLTLNMGRYAFHAIGTPLLMVAGIVLARNGGVTWTWRRGMTILTYGTVLSCILYGIYEYFGGAKYVESTEGVLRYVLAERSGPPLAAITTMTFMIAFGIGMYIHQKSWWMLAGSLMMFVAASMQLGVIANLGEVFLMVSLLMTARAFPKISFAAYQATQTALSDAERATLAEEQRSRKRKSAIWNRGLAWFIFLTLALDTYVYYSAGFDNKEIYAVAKAAMSSAYVTHIYASNIYIMFFFVHAVASLYFYGIPKLHAHIRTVHVYIGYGVFIFTMVSQSVIGMEPLHMITYIINWAFIAAHIVLSFRFMLQRVRKSQVDPMLELTVSKRLREPAR
ncbi:MAG: hypothetical protein ACK5S9_04320 [Roseiflexaceae bacterium]|jgi:hypothetical protein